MSQNTTEELVSGYSNSDVGAVRHPDAPVSLQRIFLILFFGYFAFGTLFQVFPPVLIELQTEFALDNSRASLVMSIFLAPIVLLALPSGLAVDRWGPAPAIRAGFGFMVAGVLVTLLTSTWSFLLVGRLISGVGGALLLVSLLKVVAQSVPREKLGLAVGMFAAGLPAGTVFAFNVLRPLDALGGWRLVLAGAGVLLLVAVLVFEMAAGRALPKGGAPVNLARVLNNGAMWRLAVVTVFGYAAIVGFTTWAPKILESGVAFGVYLAGSLLVPGLAVGGAVFLLVLVIVIMGIGCSMFFPAALAIPAETVSQENCGAAYGMIFTAQVVGMLIGPQVIGWILDATAPTGAFLAISLLTFIGLVFSFFLRAR